ncbi:MAG: choice-of-anchor J domain-containing protein [Bacteroidota bacterium]
MIRIFFLLSLGVSFFGQLQAQVWSRSGFPAPQDAHMALRQFPCGGMTVFEESFSDTTLPTGWVTLDLDEQSPRFEVSLLTPEPGWQLVPDFKDPIGSNTVLASPSWYDNDTVASNDWLITPLIQNLPVRTCLSWYAYSQDEFFPESYEVWLTTSGNTVDDFLNNGTIIYADSAEGSELDYTSISLDAYAGQSVYLAFRHTSQDKFVLALDDIRLAQVNSSDFAVFSIDEIRSNVNEVIAISGSIINRGLDTIRIDSSILTLSYSIDGVDSPQYVLDRLFVLPPNDTVNFIHNSPWVPTENRVYEVKVWFDALSFDVFNENDTLTVQQAIGTATSIQDMETLPITVYPNPANDQLFVSVDGSINGWRIELRDLTGRLLHARALNTNKQAISTANLSDGIYMVRLVNRDGRTQIEKIRVTR